MRQIAFGLLLAVAPLALSAQGVLTLSGQALHVSGDRQNFLEDSAQRSSFNLERFSWGGSPEKALYWNIELRAVRDLDDLAKFRLGRPGTWAIEAKYSRITSFDDTSSSNFNPAVRSFYGLKPLVFALDGEVRGWSEEASARASRTFGEGHSAWLSASLRERGGELLALYGGSYGSVLDYSVPSAKARGSVVRDAAAGLGFTWGSVQLDLEAGATNADTPSSGRVRQFGGFALNRSLLWDEEGRLEGWHASARLGGTCAKDRFGWYVGMAAAGDENRPLYRLGVEDRLYPGRWFVAGPMAIDSDAFSLFGGATWSPASTFSLGYCADLSQEEVEAQGYATPGPFLPERGAAIEERAWHHGESLNFRWAPLTSLSLSGEAGYGWRRYDRERLHGSSGLERERERRARLDLDVTASPWRLRATGKSLRRDSSGGFGDRLRERNSALLKVTFKPTRRFDAMAKFEDEDWTASQRYAQLDRSSTRIGTRRGTLALNWRPAGSLFCFLQGHWGDVKGGLRGLDSEMEAIIYAPSEYSAETRSVQAGAGLALGDRWNATLAAGQTRTTGTLDNRQRFLSGSAEYRASDSLSFSVRCQYADFADRPLPFDNYYGTLVVAAATFRF